jgi:hypothetical protein
MGTETTTIKLISIAGLEASVEFNAFVGIFKNSKFEI